MVFRKFFDSYDIKFLIRKVKKKKKNWKILVCEPPVQPTFGLQANCILHESNVLIQI